MSARWRIPLLAAVAAGLLAPVTMRAQEPGPTTSSAEIELVRKAAFALWWPEYERIMREFLRNTPADVPAPPAPDPDAFYDEIEIVGRIPHPLLEPVSMYSVTTEGDLFEALIVVSGPDRAWPLVNRVDPDAFRQEIGEAYVEATNALLERHGVQPLSAEAALGLARFTIEVFFNFDYRYVPSSIDSITFAELNRVRVLRSAEDIPQGLRRFDADRGNALLYGKIPERVEGLVVPPRVQVRAPGDYLISFYSWHPQIGEVKRWEVRLVDGQFVSLEGRTIEKWVSFTVERF